MLRFFCRFSNFTFLAIIVAAGACLRIYNLGGQSLWLDEFTSLEVSSGTFLEISRSKGFDAHTPPFYYLCLHLWWLIAPKTEFGLRFFSVFFDIFNICLIFLLGRKTVSIAFGLTAAGLYAVSPFAIYFAQEGRMYSLVITIALGLTLIAVNCVIDRQFRAVDGLCYSILGSIGLYTHYYIAFTLVVSSLVILIAVRKDSLAVVRWAASNFVILMVFAPWIPVVLKLSGSGGQGFRKFIWTVLPYSLFRFFAGYAIMPLNFGSKSDMARTVSEHVSAVLIYVLFPSVLLFRGTIRAWRANSLVLWSVVAFLAVPPTIGLAISLKAPMLSERYLVTIFPCSLVLLLLGVEGLGPLAARLTIAGIFALELFGVARTYLNSEFGKEEWREVASWIIVEADQSCVVGVAPGFFSGVLDYYRIDNNGSVSNRQHLPTFKLDDVLDESVEASNNFSQFIEGISENCIVLIRVGEMIDPAHERKANDVLTRHGFELAIDRLFSKESGIYTAIWRRKNLISSR